MKKRSKKQILMLLILFVLLNGINLFAFILHGQYGAIKKLQNGRRLNAYELYTTYVYHTTGWLLGWIVDPCSAEIMFYKQFHIVPKKLITRPKDDNVTLAAKSRIKDHETITLHWAGYCNTTSILLMNQKLSMVDGRMYYTIDCDFKPCVADIPFPDWFPVKDIIIGEILFDYLEKEKIINSFYLAIETK